MVSILLIIGFCMLLIVTRKQRWNSLALRFSLGLLLAAYAFYKVNTIELGVSHRIHSIYSVFLTPLLIFITEWALMRWSMHANGRDFRLSPSFMSPRYNEPEITVTDRVISNILIVKILLVPFILSYAFAIE